MVDTKDNIPADPSAVDEEMGNAPKKNKKKTKLDNSVIVRERDFKSSSSHSDTVTGICKVDNNEFLTASMDKSMKVWDKFTQGVSYTFETHEPLTTMGITGEKGEFLVCGLGEGHLIVFGKERSNQLSIVEWAHAQPIIKVVSLSRISGKYFATRCVDGHVMIYSSLSQPDRIAQLFNFDADAEALAHLQPKEEEVEEVKEEKKKKTRINEDGEEEEYDDEEDEEDQQQQQDDEEEDDEKKDEKPKILPPQPPILIGRPEPSDKDTMIEIQTKALIQSSSTMLAVSCFNEKQVIICNVDIKTRTKTIKQTFKNKESPTFLYQIDAETLLVGNVSGKFEIWNIDHNLEEPELSKEIDAHPGSETGISNIIKLVDPSPMIVGDKVSEDTEILVSSAADQADIVIWRLEKKSNGKNQLNSYIKINTSFNDGIKYILQTSPTQLVGVNHEQTLMFYDFVDKHARAEQKNQEKATEEFASLVEQAFHEADKDGNNWLDIDECRPMCESLIRSFGDLVSNEARAQLLEKLFSWLDSDNSGKVTFHEFKVALMRAYVKRQLPQELIVE